MENNNEHVVYAQMKTRQKGEWARVAPQPTPVLLTKQRLRNISISAAAVFCLGVGAVSMLDNRERTAEVASQVTADFEYDETLGRLQFVSNILPESAMVFLSSEDSSISVFAPSASAVSHAWSTEEPWLEYACRGSVSACCDGDVMTVVKNRENEYTVRMMHENGYESVYSGLYDVSIDQFDHVLAGETIGYADGTAAFEFRKDGLSILPEFEEGQHSEI